MFLKKLKKVFGLFLIITIVVFSYGCSVTTINNSSHRDIWQYQSNLKLEPESVKKRVGIYYPKINRSENLPSSIDLSENMPPVKSQGGQGSCTSWAVGYAAMTYMENKENGGDLSLPINQFSPAFFYNQIHEGFVSSILDMAVEKGCIQLPYFPYDEHDSSKQPSIFVLTRALQYRAKSWQYLNKSVESLKSVLANEQVVIFVTAIYDDLYRLSDDNPIYDTIQGKKYGYHALCMVGYDDEKQAFKFINSWGDSWGINGYGWYSYDLIDTDVFVNAYLLFDKPDKKIPNPKIIHYYSAYENANIHYEKTDGYWTNVPGIPMAKEGDNWFVTTIDNTNDFTFCFYSGGWDSKGGQNYHTNLREVWIKDETVYNNNPETTEIILNFIDKESNEPIIHQSIRLTNLSTNKYESKWSGETGTIRFEDVENGNYKLSSTKYSDYLFDGYKQEYSSTFTINNNDHIENIYLIKCIGSAGIYFNIEDQYYSYNPLIGSSLDIYKGNDFFRTVDIGKMSYSVAHSSISQLPAGEYRAILSTVINSIKYSGELLFSISEDNHYFSGDMYVRKTTANQKTIHYYNDNFVNSYIHYQKDDLSWTKVPGIKMLQDNNNWSSITIMDNGQLTFCFNDGNNNWDSQNGNNYTTNLNECWIKNGIIYSTMPLTNNATLFNATINNLPFGYMVKVCGSFEDSNWQTGIPMTNTGNNVWTLSYNIEDSQFEYKFICEDETGNRIWESYWGNRYGSSGDIFTNTVYF